MMEVEEKKMDEITDEIRDIINLIKVFEGEYDLPEEAVNQMRNKLEGIVQKIAAL
ncbi:MAG: hypothetical protein U9R34_06890 [Nanoarchaeota archaeon]|nr:hypothetical protein [Nanoarchaeota archaeon]